MAKIKVVNKSGLKNLKEKFNLFRNSPEDVQKAGDVMIDQIYADTRRGKQYDGSAMNDLADSTLKNRKYLAKYNATHSLYRQKKSNLTLTGDLLDKLKFKIVTSKFLGIFGEQLVVMFYSEENHKPYYGKKGQVVSKGAPIAKIFRAQMERYKIFGISARTRKQIVQLFKRFLRRQLTR